MIMKTKSRIKMTIKLTIPLSPAAAVTFCPNRPSGPLHPLSEPAPGLLEAFRRHNEDFARRVGVGRAVSTLRKYRTVEHLLADYLRRGHTTDIPLSGINEAWAADFVRYLFETRGLAPGTVRLYVTALRRILALARRRGQLWVVPFAEQDLPRVEARREFLTGSEVKALAALQLEGTEAEVQRLFLFSCYTGLAYADLCRLAPCHVDRDADGAVWICLPRRKTGRTSVVRLLPAAASLFDAMCRTGGERLFHVPANRCCNTLLRAIAARAGICRRLHFHLGRHTFATRAIEAGLPIETVSLILGHSRVTTTQIYAQVTRRKVARDLCLLATDAFI